MFVGVKAGLVGFATVAVGVSTVGVSVTGIGVHVSVDVKGLVVAFGVLTLVVEVTVAVFAVDG